MKEANTSLPKQKSRHWRALWWITVAGATCSCAFVLPFCFPPNDPVLSVAYQMGANNRAAEVSLAVLSVLVTLVVARFNLGGKKKAQTETDTGNLSGFWLSGAVAFLFVGTATLGFFVARSDVIWGDEGYFLNQLRTGMVFHRTLYRGFEFPYGPALYLWPAAFIRVLGTAGVRRTAAYLISLVALQALGLWLLFYTINVLPLSRRLKAVAFTLFTIAAMNPFLGINYTIFRFICPLASATLLCRTRTLARAMLVACLGVVAQFLVSPELAAAFFGAAFVYGCYRALITSRRWLLVSVSAAAGGIFFTLVAGKTYFLTMASIAKGGFNLLLQPMPHTIVLLAAISVLAPIAVGRALASREPEAGLLITLLVVSLGLLPAAMGRADAVHLLMNGMGVYLLSLVAVKSMGQLSGRVWVLLVTTACLLTQALNLRAYVPNFRELNLHSTVHGLNINRLARDLDGKRVSAPANLPPPSIDALTVLGLYRPGFYCGLVGVWDEAAEDRIVTEMRADAFTLLPNQGAQASEPFDNSRLKQIMRLGYVYKEQHHEVIIGRKINAEIRSHWVPVDSFGYYTLYKRVR